MAGPFFVMAGLGPAIHDFGWRNTKSWIPAPESRGKNRAGMTKDSGGHDESGRA